MTQKTSRTYIPPEKIADFEKALVKELATLDRKDIREREMLIQYAIYVGGSCYDGISSHKNITFERLTELSDKAKTLISTGLQTAQRDLKDIPFIKTEDNVEIDNLIGQTAGFIEFYNLIEAKVRSAYEKFAEITPESVSTESHKPTFKR